MAQLAAGDSRRRPAGRPSGRKGALQAIADAPPPSHAIPLDLGKLIAPYKQHGRLTLRIEQMPILSRLSRGRNNGDNSWSLGLDELEDLEFLAPEGSDDTYRLAIRVIAYGSGDASTVAVLDFSVSCGEDSPDALAQSVGQLRPAADNGFAAAAAQFASDLERERTAWKEREEARIAELERHASEKLEEARKSWLRKSKTELAKAETAWNAAEAARLAAAEMQWREQPAKDLAEARTSTAAAGNRGEAELHRLRGQLAEAQAALADRERESIAARSSVAETAKRLLEEKRIALSEAEENWKAGEAARLAANKKHWQKDAGRALATIAMRCEAAEKALAETRNAAGTARDETRIALGRLRDDLTKAHETLAEREAQLAEWTTRCETAETTLKQKRLETDAAADRDRERLRRLDGELTAARTALAAREEDLARLRAANAEEREDLEHEVSAALAKAEGTWKTGEAARLAAAEARARERFAGALDEATARYETAEQALAEIRRNAKSVHDRSDPGLMRLYDEIARLQAALSGRETELAGLRPGADGAGTHRHSSTAAAAGYRRHARAGGPDGQDEIADGKRGLLRDIVLVVALVMSAIAFYPALEARFRGVLAPGNATNAIGSPAPKQPAAAASSPAAGERTALAVRGVNLRSEPSVTAAIVSTLGRGTKVAIIAESGKWMHVRLPSGTRQNRFDQGWVYGSYLETANVPAQIPKTKPQK